MSKVLPVIFRKFNDGEIIAFFPTLVDSFNQFECLSYMNIGQHSVARTELITTLKKCTREEYTPLLNEIKSIYNENTLMIESRSKKEYYNIRLAECKRLLGMK